MPGGAGGAVRFAGDEFGRSPALIARSVEADEFAHAFHIARRVVEFAHFLAIHHAAVARAHRIDEHQVAFIQQRIFVVHQAVGRLGRVALGIQLHPARAEQAQVHPH